MTGFLSTFLPKAARHTVLLAGLFLTATLLSATPATSANLPLDAALAERSLGDEKAPVTVHEYFSLSCSHCAAFHNDILPKVKTDYIDTGRVRFVFHDFPLGGLASAAAMLTRCGDPDAYHGFVSVLLKEQKKWLRSDTPLEELEGFARLVGMSSDDVMECLDNEPLFKEIESRKIGYNRDLGVKSTPTFIIGKTVVPGNLPYAEFREVLDKALKEAGAK